MQTKTRFTRKTVTLAAATVGMALFSVGCAITDYRGYLGHMTESESKMWGSESASRTADPNETGTYSYTVKYDFCNLTVAQPTRTCPGGTAQPAICTYPSAIDIYTYRNPVFGAFSRDGCVDRDGDDLQQRPGTLQRTCENAQPAGKFDPKWWYIDRNFGCQFNANFKQEFEPQPKNPAAIQVCFNGPVEEIDRDLSLQGAPQSNLKEAFLNADDLISKIWSGALGNSFTAEVDEITFDGKTVTLGTPAVLSIARNDFRPINMSVDVTSPGAQEVLRAILDNTTDDQSVTITARFVGGLRLSQPTAVTVAFDHDVLSKFLQ